MAECCHPIPGDDVLGYVDENDRIIIHKRQCPVAAKLKSSYGNRILATEWDTHKELSFLVYIYIKGIDSMGLLSNPSYLPATECQHPQIDNRNQRWHLRRKDTIVGT